MLRISIIIPSFNSYRFMSRCLKSLETQTFKEFEVIFVDDCSTDGTYKLLLNYLQRTSLSYKVIRNDRNIGPGASRNNGIKNASAKYIAFMDSDDWYEDNYLENMYSTAINGEFDVVMCDYFRAYDNGKKKSRNPTKYFDYSMGKKDFIAYSFDSLCCMLINKELFDGILIPNKFNAEDVAIIPILLSKAEKIGFIHMKLYNYFYRNNSLSNSKPVGNSIACSIFESYKYIYERISIEFKEETEFIGIKTVMYGTVLNAIQSKYSKIKIKLFIEEFEKINPGWYENKYLSKLPMSKRVFIFFVKNRNYYILQSLSFIRTLLLRIKVG